MGQFLDPNNSQNSLWWSLRRGMELIHAPNLPMILHWHRELYGHRISPLIMDVIE